jgi:hypothetical protein
MKIIVNGQEIEAKAQYCLVSNSKKSGYVDAKINLTVSTFLSDYEKEKLGDRIVAILRA